MKELEDKLESIRAELDELYRQRRHATRTGRSMIDLTEVQRRVGELEEREQRLRHQLWELMIRN